jgi:hypothetical protein
VVRSGRHAAAADTTPPPRSSRTRGVQGRGSWQATGLARRSASPWPRRRLRPRRPDAQKKISRSDERGYSGAESAPRARARENRRWTRSQFPGGKKKYYN